MSFDPTLPVYQSLYRNPHFIELHSSNVQVIAEDVAMDHYKITDEKVIGTYGVATCFAVCSQGRKIDGKHILALAHSCLQSIQHVVRVLKTGLVNSGCIRSDISTYIIGGKLTYEGESTSCSDQENETLRIATKVGIRGARFNLTAEDEQCLNIIFTPHRVFYSTHDIFIPIDNSKGIRIP